MLIDLKKSGSKVMIFEHFFIIFEQINDQEDLDNNQSTRAAYLGDKKENLELGI